MTTNDLKKGDRVKLRNGWFATIIDNRKGNSRLADVEGYYREIGSVYSHDIAFKVYGEDVDLDPIEHTPAQLKLKERVEKMGF